MQPKLPIRAAFYYPWFPETWGPSSNPFTNYHPSAGLYDSTDSATIKHHIDAMQYGGIQAGISSWWGQGTKTDQRMPGLLRAADGTGFRWTVYYEPEAQGDPTVAQLQDDLTYLSSHYGNDPSFLRIDGRFVVFVYADGADACGMASRWAQANTVNAYIVLKVFSGFKTCAQQPAGWHQYGPASASADMAPYSYTISPGFWKKGETARLTRDPARWANQVAAMASSTAQFQLITTFNEWGEGTAVESADEWSSPSGYGAYLDILHGLPVSTSPSPTATSSSPTPTSSSSSPPPATNPVVVIYMENKERSGVIGSSSATYQNALRAQGIDFTHYYGVTHPSLPNYLALGNGATDGKQGTDSITAGELPQSPTLWNQLENAGVSWGVYEEDMPSTCSGATTSGLYALKHNPATPFASVFTNTAVCSHVQPYTRFDVHAMPKVSFIAPNLCNDEHDCPISTGDTGCEPTSRRCSRTAPPSCSPTTRGPRAPASTAPPAAGTSTRWWSARASPRASMRGSTTTTPCWPRSSDGSGSPGWAAPRAQHPCRSRRAPFLHPPEPPGSAAPSIGPKVLGSAVDVPAMAAEAP